MTTQTRLISTFTWGRATAESFHAVCDCGWQGKNHRTVERAVLDQQRHEQRCTTPKPALVGSFDHLLGA